MTRVSTSRLLVGAGAVLLALHVWHDVFGLGPLDHTFSEWYMPVAFLGSGIAALVLGSGGRERPGWRLLGVGLILYAAGSVYYSLACVLNLRPGFPSLADALWLCMYPLAALGIAAIVRARFVRAGAAVWLDGAIVGSAVAALAAAFFFGPVFDLTVDNGAASIARLGYPFGDLMGLGFAVAAWTLGGRPHARLWGVLALGFGLLAIGDGVYVVQAARGTWSQASAYNIVYLLATMLLATPAWYSARRGGPQSVDTEANRLWLAVVCGSIGLGLAGYAAFADLNPVATALALGTLLGVVLRLGFALGRLHRQRSALAVIAATDPLTDLANHRAVHERLDEELEQALALGTPLSVVALDLDHFKSINDTYGHTEGDLALQAVADVLAAEAGSADLVGRVGGEEFVLVVPGAGGDEAFALAERCRAAVSTLTVHGHPLACSAGVASYPTDDAEGARLLELADGALYWAKRSGRGQTRRYDPREVVLLSGAEQVAQVRAVLEDDDAMAVVFQPIVELATGRVAGYEALTRFVGDGPTRTPDLWFAQARRCGLGPALEAKAIRNALSVPGRPAGTFLSINVSPASLLSREVAAALPADLSEIVIELTEDEVFSKDAALDVELDALRARGARVAVDDAGSGYSGLQQLIRIKPEILKLDRSLISGVDMDRAKKALLESFARFAMTTGTAVCGEGVETVEEMRTLTKVDTTYAQGFVLARPGEGWPTVSVAAAEEASAEVSAGMRLAPDTGPIGLGDVSETLARIRSARDLNAALGSIRELLHADSVVVSRVLAEERAVQTVTDNDEFPVGEVFSYDDYRTTEHVAVAQVIGQLIEGDPKADEAELRLLAESGYRALLMAPIVFRGITVGLLELYRRAAQPWTAAEIDQGRVLAHHLGAAIYGGLEESLPWSPDALVSRSPKAGISDQAGHEGEESG
jgi:diguanylate cyclase (GGDEF)-like protein